MSTRFPAGPLWLIGCGNMGGAMLRRWIAAGLDPSTVTVITRSGKGAPEGVRSLTVLPDENAPATLMLALKPQQIDAAQALLAPMRGAPTLLLSILAGVDHATLSERFAADTIVRAMPNLPVAVGKGVTSLYTVATSDEAVAAAEAFSAPLGHYEWIADEAHFDAVTALAGCGPGFVFRFADALAKAGAALGLPAEQAARLAIATLEGAAIMAADADVSPAVLADRVASPGGSTREGMNVLDRDDALVALLTQTLAASERRNAEMAAAAR
ncbi:pyrroline-5-carboxylate reductase dimerization domain-containing protein [Sphingomonas sp. PP-CE-1G-424]|uniref:pyrroline-5-carboxylate reductase family protein n=1 Tax=Sphingomonas sp. PP-CE-1G-424 TaxID=2135658 RepID=UPI0010554A47|nr:pyrroline-5-carboxylate reductase dimerization domain-containing protein [Sphingomonas sp. PP-CE-1G-424]TCP66976.1 pyrroline-5-carboxylate reductase [Sphingomonas sp. PP-CE-1G-424]